MGETEPHEYAQHLVAASRGRKGGRLGAKSGDQPYSHGADVVHLPTGRAGKVESYVYQPANPRPTELWGLTPAGAWTVEVAARRAGCGLARARELAGYGRVPPMWGEDSVTPPDERVVFVWFGFHVGAKLVDVVDLEARAAARSRYRAEALAEALGPSPGQRCLSLGC